LKCHNKVVPFLSKTCPEGKNLCYKMTLKKVPKIPIKRGCTDACPKSSLLVNVMCCKTDKCN
uniref:Cytotoxin 2 n=1 Tax=Hemachatus haemachatus TaxID=8626 RepID=3SB2_HEMHA|nr:RecName: Full=Cytotoxin 2; AltName: Full=Toxin 12A [Hemachatus haemachatus]